ncbi:MAG: ribosome hibernation-promoting factor, HPF/YfiA family [Eubacteriales bacterium]|jgi:putative sigma-54 modulation protein
MKVTILGKKMDISDNFRGKIEKKLSKLDKFFHDDADVRVLLTDVKGKQKVEVTIVSLGVMYRAQEVSDDFMVSLEEAVDTLERQIRKNKTRLAKKLKAGKINDMPAFFGTGDEEAEDDFDVIKVKKFPLKPMSVEEAILEMNLLSHQFFVFLDADTETTCVVYKRNDGGYGLIEPQS